jgi:tetratricopeptide (TPR) repeat protein
MTIPFEDEIRELESEAERSDAGTAAHILNRAGDMCLGQGRKDRALSYYGRAIDANLYGRRYDAAAGLCRKLLRISPRSVRTRCTLAWLALGHGDLQETVRELGEYVSAAIDAGERERAATNLAAMAAVTPDRRIRELLAAHLERIGKPADAEALRGGSQEAGGANASAGGDSEEERWTRIVNAALGEPKDR